MLNNIYLAVLFLALLASLNAFRLNMAKPLKWFAGFLLFVCVAETCAVMWPRAVRYYNLHYSKENHWVYNLYLLPGYLFYLFFYYHILENRRIKRIVAATAIVFGLGALVNLLFVQGIFRLNTYSVIAAGLLVVAFSLAYFYQLVYTKFIPALHRNPLFWISAGTLLFHLTTMVGLFFIVFLNNWYGRAAYATSLIIKITSIVMYIAYSIAFLCPRKA